MKKVLVIMSSLRSGSNSDALAEAFAEGAREAGHEVETVSLRDKNIAFCRGCMVCLKTRKCRIDDDVAGIIAGMHDADVLVFSSPLFYYNISGKLKTLLDRSLPLSESGYRFSDVYLLTAGGDEPNGIAHRSAGSIMGWLDCFPGTTLKGVVEVQGVNWPGDIGPSSPQLQECKKMGVTV